MSFKRNLFRDKSLNDRKTKPVFFNQMIYKNNFKAAPQTDNSLKKIS